MSPRWWWQKDEPSLPPEPPDKLQEVLRLFNGQNCRILLLDSEGQQVGDPMGLQPLAAYRRPAQIREFLNALGGTANHQRHDLPERVDDQNTLSVHVDVTVEYHNRYNNYVPAMPMTLIETVTFGPQYGEEFNDVYDIDFSIRIPYGEQTIVVRFDDGNALNRSLLPPPETEYGNLPDDDDLPLTKQRLEVHEEYFGELPLTVELRDRLVADEQARAHKAKLAQELKTAAKEKAVADTIDKVAAPAKQAITAWLRVSADNKTGAALDRMWERLVENLKAKEQNGSFNYNDLLRQLSRQQADRSQFVTMRTTALSSPYESGRYPVNTNHPRDPFTISLLDPTNAESTATLLQWVHHCQPRGVKVYEADNNGATSIDFQTAHGTIRVLFGINDEAIPALHLSGTDEDPATLRVANSWLEGAGITSAASILFPAGRRNEKKLLWLADCVGRIEDWRVANPEKADLRYKFGSMAITDAIDQLRIDERSHLTSDSILLEQLATVREIVGAKHMETMLTTGRTL